MGKQVQNQVSDYHYQQDKDTIHRPQAAMLDTPEMRRIRATKKLNSDIAYRQEARNASANVYACLDTPDMRRVKKNTKNFSDVKYRTSAESKGLPCLDMATQRALQVSKNTSNISYRGVPQKREKMESVRGSAVNAQQAQQPTRLAPISEAADIGSRGETYYRASERSSRYRADPGSIFDYDPTESDSAPSKRSRPANRRQYQEQPEDFEADNDYAALEAYTRNLIGPQGSNRTATNWMDYLQGEYKSVHPSNDVNRPTEVLTEAQKLASISKDQVAQAKHAAQLAAQQEVAEFKRQDEQGERAKSGRLNLSSYGYQFATTDDAASIDDGDVSNSDESSYKINTFVAMFGYDPQEEDELRLLEGDMVDECQFIGEGWLYGYNRRTGEAGMLPANYVESTNC